MGLTSSSLHGLVDAVGAARLPFGLVAGAGVDSWRASGALQAGREACGAGEVAFAGWGDDDVSFMEDSSMVAAPCGLAAFL